MSRLFARIAVVAVLALVLPFLLAACTPKGGTLTQACAAPCPEGPGLVWKVKLTGKWQGIRPGPSGNAVTIHYDIHSNSKDDAAVKERWDDSISQSIPPYRDTFEIPVPKSAVAINFSVLAEDDAKFSDSFFTSCLIEVEDTTGEVIASNKSEEDSNPKHAVCVLPMNKVQIGKGK